MSAAKKATTTAEDKGLGTGAATPGEILEDDEFFE